MKQPMIYGTFATVLLVLVSTGLFPGRASAQGDPTLPPELEEALERAWTFSGANDDWESFVWNFDGVEMALVPAGCFMMGSENGGRDERPVHEICFEEPFWIDITEVTNGQFVAFGGQAGIASHWAGVDRPRELVTWFEAWDFCTLRGGRLLTEAEWEYAARGPDGPDYPWGNTFEANHVVYKENSGDQTADVGSRPGNASWIGTLEMSGNVWEWTSSIYLGYPYQTDDGRESTSDTSSRRVLRGGSLVNDPDDLRGTTRNWARPNLRTNSWGFRCARSAESATTAAASESTLAQGDPHTSTELEEALERAWTFSGANDDWEPFVWDFDGIEMVLVPAGCFMMGSTEAQLDAAFQQCEKDFGSGQCDRKFFEDQAPVHQVCFDEPFWIGHTEVTNEQYKTCVDAGACTQPDDRQYFNDPAYATHPVVAVNWLQASAYAAWIGGSLPTEAEWEYAARGPDAWEYPWGDAFDGARLNFCDTNCTFDWQDTAYDDGYEVTAPVGDYPDGASWVGALDVSGNVWEWTSSIYLGYPYDAADGRENSDDTIGRRVVRGGSWHYSQHYARAAARPSRPLDYKYLNLGFRVVVHSPSQ